MFMIYIPHLHIILNLVHADCNTAPADDIAHGRRHSKDVNLVKED